MESRARAMPGDSSHAELPGLGAWLIAAVAVAGGLVWFDAVGAKTVNEAAHGEARPDGERVAVPVADQSGQREPVAAADEAAFDARAFILAYPHGDAILARLANEGVDLDSLPPPAIDEAAAREAMVGSLQLSPRASASKRAARMSWPEDGELTNRWLAEEVGLSAVLDSVELAELTAAIAPEQIVLEDAVNGYYDVLEAALADSVARGQFELYPYFHPQSAPTAGGVTIERGGAFYSKSASLTGGWVGSISLHRDDHPLVVTELATVEGARARRDQRVRELVASWQ